MKPGEHSVLAPSSAARRVVCPGSRQLEALYPETEPSLASLEGTAAHWVFAELFNDRTVMEGDRAPNGVLIDGEMLEGADLFVEDVRSLAGDLDELHIEEPVSIATINPECWGTPDVWGYRPGLLVVWDYKFGHRFVDAFENWQLIEYAAGILERVGIDGMTDQSTLVVFRIVQPRYYGAAPVREWRVMASDLRAAFNILRDREAQAMTPNAPCFVSPECGDCRARAGCVTLQVAVGSAIDLSLSAVAFDLPPDTLGAELKHVDRALTLLEARRTGLAGQAVATIKSGVNVPNYRLEATTGRTRWARPEAEIVIMAQAMGVDVLKSKLITPKQAVDKGLDASVVKAFSETPSGEAKLVFDDGSAARKAFS